MLLKEYRVCMPLTVEEYRRGQLYMINRHTNEESEEGEGVEVIRNEPCFDEDHGDGQITEKRIHLNSRLPPWAKSFLPSIYVTETAWNFYPYTITEYTCAWLPRLKILVETRYEDNNGNNDVFSCCSKVKKEQSAEEFDQREIVHLDIAYDAVSEKHEKTCPNCTKFKSIKTGRGELQPDWRDTHTPIMCSYKLVLVKFEVWGMQTKVERFIHSNIREILLLAHRQAFTWIDEWYDMTFEKVREFECKLQAETNDKVRNHLTVQTTPSETTTY